MNLKYWRMNANSRNFGDELNISLFNRLFGSVFAMEKYKHVDFYGIGTLISPEIGTENRSVIFGAGIRDVVSRYDKKNWDVFFLRGPVSSNILGYNGDKFITDAAYAILLVDDLMPRPPKRYPMSVMPHWTHMSLIDWELVSEQMDVHVIDPCGAVETIMEEIAGSEKIVAAAMHGAILADIYRITWARLRMEVLPREPFFVFDLKWKDWLHSMNLSEISLSLRNIHTQYDHDKTMFTREIIKSLQQAIKNDRLFQLSGDLLLGNKVNCISNEADRFLNCYK